MKIWIYVFTFRFGKPEERRVFTCEIEAENQEDAHDLAWTKATNTARKDAKIYAEVFYGPYLPAK